MQAAKALLCRTSRDALWTAPAERNGDGAFGRPKMAGAKAVSLPLCGIAIAVQDCHPPIMSADKIPWPHAPEHRLSVRGTYFVTASTYLRQHHFKGKNRLAVLHRGLLKVTATFGWQLEAWAVFCNHYHFVAHSPAEADTAESLSRMLGLLHEKTAKWINKLDAAPARKVWHNYRETRLTYEKSYLARLNYVHQNAVKHRLVPVANQYPWCSARWFERIATPAQIKTLYRFKTERLSVPDDFEVSSDW
jgi:putative transposase